MKLNALLAAIFVAGLAASIAFAAPRPRDDGDHGDRAKAQHCKNVELKGTLANGTLSLAVEKANKAGAALGTSVTVGYGGRVKVHARLCQAAGASTTAVLQLRELKVEGRAADTTTTTSATTATTTTTGH